MPAAGAASRHCQQSCRPFGQTVGRRLDVSQTQTAPLLDYDRNRGLLVRVAGEGPVDRVAEAIRKAVKEPVAS